MFGSSSEHAPRATHAPDCFEPPAGAPIAEPMVPRLMALFGLRACWYESFPFDGQLPRIEAGGICLPAEEPGITSWSLDMGVELPVRYSGLTLGRFVLVPTAPTTGVQFSPGRRADAISMVVHVGNAIAAAMLDESDANLD